jgi:hypothetical protein
MADSTYGLAYEEALRGVVPTAGRADRHSRKSSDDAWSGVSLHLLSRRHCAPRSETDWLELDCDWSLPGCGTTDRPNGRHLLPTGCLRGAATGRAGSSACRCGDPPVAAMAGALTPDGQLSLDLLVQVTPCMPCSLGLLPHPRSGVSGPLSDPLRVTVTVRLIPLVPAASGTRVARPVKDHLARGGDGSQLVQRVRPVLGDHRLVGQAANAAWQLFRSRRVADAFGARVLRDQDRSAGRARQGRSRP